MNEFCAYEIHPGSWHIDPEPPEYCNDPVEAPGEAFCQRHGGQSSLPPNND